jgi:hypothetical protein
MAAAATVFVETVGGCGSDGGGAAGFSTSANGNGPETRACGSGLPSSRRLNASHQ